MRTRVSLLIGCLGSLFAAASVAGTAADQPTAAAAEPGVWHKHEYSFEFMGFTSRYSCDGLADQLQRLLLLSGARADAKAQAGACASGFGQPDRFARATLVFYTLSPSAPGGASGEAGAGQWRTVALSAHHPFELLMGDCELVEQFHREVLTKMFTVRNVVNRTTCVPHQESGSLIDLRFETFAPAAGAPAVGVAPTVRSQVFAYPQRGQTAAQQTKDRSECEASAAAQSGKESAAPSGAAPAASGDAYARALAACLERRGYSVR